MTATRRYRLLCPIARALDRVGDRWTLLILRDLHAGPARFSDLLAGLRGIASNLLTDRLAQLQEDGLVRRYEGEHGVALYALTGLGRETRDLLFALAAFGGRLPPEADPREPGNSRAMAVTLAAACSRAVTPEIALVARLDVGTEPFALVARDGAVSVTAGAPETPQATLATSYEAMVAAGDGRLPPEALMAGHATVVAHQPGADVTLLALLSRALAIIAEGRA